VVLLLELEAEVPLDEELAVELFAAADVLVVCPE
jgi:hypothetical protein